MPVTLTKKCDKPGCLSRIDGECALTFRDHKNSDLILEDGDLLKNDLDRAARDAGWVESLGDWTCEWCQHRAKVGSMKLAGVA